MASTSSSEIDAKVQQSLQGTPFAASALKKLSGGSVNWVYQVKLLKPLEDGTTDVVVKHGEAFMATRPEFALNSLRCRIEIGILKRICERPFLDKSLSGDHYNLGVRTAKVFHFDEDNLNQIQECLPNGTDLKSYALQYYQAPTPESFQPQCRQIGQALGRWQKGFIEWSAQQTDLRQMIAQHKQIQEIRHMVNFAWLHDRIKEFPDVLDDASNILEEVEKTAAAESQDTSKLQFIHGDFWTGNILLPNRPILEDVETPMFVIDWESAQLGLPSVDLGQMIAEMYALWLYKSIKGGLWMIEGLVESYGDFSEDFVFRTAIQVGAHILCITTTFPGWGTPEQVKEVARIGKDIIVHAWKRDKTWFENSELACLFGGTSS